VLAAVFTREAASADRSLITRASRSVWDYTPFPGSLAPLPCYLRQQRVAVRRSADLRFHTETK